MAESRIELDRALARTAEQPDAGEVLTAAESNTLCEALDADGCHGFLHDHVETLAALGRLIAAREAAAVAAAGERIARAIEALSGPDDVGLASWKSDEARDGYLLAIEESASAARTTTHADALAGVIREAQAAAMCDNRGPRIGEDCPRCRRPLNHTGVHQNVIEDGFGQVMISW